MSDQIETSESQDLDWLAIASIIGFERTNRDNVESISFDSFSILDEDNQVTTIGELNRGLLGRRLELPTPDVTESLLIELSDESEVSEVTLEFSGNEATVLVRLFGEDSDITSPLSEVTLIESATINLPQPVDAKFATIEINSPETSETLIDNFSLN